MGIFSAIFNSFFENVEDKAWLRNQPNHPYYLDKHTFPVTSGKCYQRESGADSPGRHVWIYFDEMKPTIRSCEYCGYSEDRSITTNEWVSIFEA